MAQGGEEEKKEPRREKGEKALWGEEGAGKRSRGRRGSKGRGEALRGESSTREDCMTEVSKAACLHQDHSLLACSPCYVLAGRPLWRDWRNHLWWVTQAPARGIARAGNTDEPSIRAETGGALAQREEPNPH